MLCIQSPNTDIYFNLAAEEYLFKNFSDDIFMLWRNEPSIVVGKHQNTLAEINLDFVHKNRIRVARRLSGGGTVYHDEGNLNFTFIFDLLSFIFRSPDHQRPGQSGNDYHHLGKSCRRILGSPLSGGADARDFIQNPRLTPLFRSTPAG